MAKKGKKGLDQATTAANTETESEVAVSTEETVADTQTGTAVEKEPEVKVETEKQAPPSASEEVPHLTVDHEEEATTSSPSRGGRTPFVGPLPDDFLVVRRGAAPQSNKNRYLLVVNINRATLLKNQGALPMSLYAVVMVGRGVTNTTMHDYCGTSPVWDTTVQFDLHGKAPRRLRYEIYDWGILSDTKVAWGEVPLEHVYQPHGHISGWFELEGAEGRAGEILLDISLRKERAHTADQTPSDQEATARAESPLPDMQEQQQISAEEQARILETAAAVQQQAITSLAAMFPQLDEEVLRSVYVACGGDVEAAVIQCLGLLQG
eukprot:comp16832_c0_seq1/m.15257 comp16832_c0_seq1/g.15257  ORF comp16832_c0_seq1/g.15257 comp16832_c0_seq1/m.15257 type:complete len:322 (-) comp16832_c0_seq1:25-990(-)